MSRVKIKEQMVYFHKNIRKNHSPKKIEPEPQQRPKTTPHRRFFTSAHYKPIPQQTIPSIDPSLRTLNTLELHNNIYVRQSRSTRRRSGHSFLQSCVIEKTKQHKIKENTFEGRLKFNEGENGLDQFVTALVDSNSFFQKLERTMVQSLVLVGTRRKYEKGDKIDLSNKNIGFVLYGKIKLFMQDFTYTMSRGDTLGQHLLFSNHLELKVRFQEDSAILWVPISNYNVLRQESVKQGFRHDFNKIDTQLRLSYIKKKYPKQ